MLGLKYQVNNLSRYTLSSIPRLSVGRYYSTEGQEPLTSTVQAETQKINKSLIPLVPDASTSITDLELQDKLVRSKSKDLDTKAKIVTFPTCLFSDPMVRSPSEDQVVPMSDLFNTNIYTRTDQSRN